MKAMRSQRFQGNAYCFAFSILLSTTFGQFTTQTSNVALAIGNISETQIPPIAPDQTSTITTSTLLVETEDAATGESTDDRKTLRTAPGTANDPATGTEVSEMSDDLKVSDKEVRIFMKIVQNIQKKLEAVEEKFDKLTSKLTGEQLGDALTEENIAFFAQRNSSFNKKKTIQPYLINRLNDGEAFNQESGKFTVPMNGNYHFYFTALKANAKISGTSIITIRLWANKNQKGKTPLVLTEGHVNSNDMYGWFPITLHATVKLQKNDTVEVELHDGSIHESGNLEHLLTSFGGFLVPPKTK